jgi:hypothetical protein
LSQDLHVEVGAPFLERRQSKLQERARAIMQHRPELENYFDPTLTEHRLDEITPAKQVRSLREQRTPRPGHRLTPPMSRQSPSSRLKGSLKSQRSCETVLLQPISHHLSLVSKINPGGESAAES